ncbi:hypothetical protein T07_15067 [Trichinella nelsoni]|uniref:Uncharacterized protein n=1 Tax=Trichinella nelsoni TaxID=6336 RepID=A0A0V0SCH2_9BILA|nr:hypothetical protein T07_15067 [Trichinella nelsoni]
MIGQRVASGRPAPVDDLPLRPGQRPGPIALIHPRQRRIAVALAPLMVRLVDSFPHRAIDTMPPHCIYIFGGRMSRVQGPSITGRRINTVRACELFCYLGSIDYDHMSSASFHPSVEARNSAASVWPSSWPAGRIVSGQIMLPELLFGGYMPFKYECTFPVKAENAQAGVTDEAPFEKWGLFLLASELCDFTACRTCMSLKNFYSRPNS